MKKTIFIFLMLTGFILAQERTYIEFVPMMTYRSAPGTESQMPAFSWYLGMNLMLGKSFGVKPFIEFDNYKVESFDIYETNNMLTFNKFGIGFRYYIGGNK